ncbi:MAG: YlxR family protein [Oscillospiraceae bacterium]|nr:YlxR family protein [Oscillospiraceae bacterium]
MKTKKTPLRMCLGCGEMKPKRELIRVVRRPDETIVLDATGKLSGRGAYICPSAECLIRAQKGRRLEKTFSCRIEDEVYTHLQQMLTEAGADE